jgi:hypothetical protein
MAFQKERPSFKREATNELYCRFRGYFTAFKI